MKADDKPIGIALCDIEKDEYCIEVNLLTGEIKSEKIKFFPYGKKKVLEKLFFGWEKGSANV